MFELIFAVLCVEVAFVGLLVSPLPNRARRAIVQWLGRSLPSSLVTPAKYIALSIVLGWLYTTREMFKYEAALREATSKPGIELATQLQHESRLFLAQRDFYLSGFCALLLLVGYRLFLLVKELNQLSATQSALKRQAEGAAAGFKAASEEKERLQRALDEAADSLGGSVSVSSGGDAADELELARGTIAELRERTKKLLEERDQAAAAGEAMKRQAEGLSTEYGRLMREKESLENKLADFELVCGDEVKKSK